MTTRTTPRNPTQRLSVPGIPIWSGIIRDESLHPTLKPLHQRIREYNQMANDGVVATLLEFIRLALLSGAVDVAGPNEEANAFLWENIQGMDTPISEILSEALDVVRHGFALQEMVFRMDNGRVVLDDLYPIFPETLVGTNPWGMDEKGRLENVEQRDPTTGQTATIPGAKMLHYTLNSRRRNPEGRSLLADLWVTWKMKQHLLEMLGICIERTSIGIPVIYPPYEVTDDGQKTELLSVLAGIRTDEKAGVLMPGQKQGTSGDVPGWLLETLEVSGDPVGIQQAIDYLDNVILGRGFAAFLKLGTGEVGSFALHKSAAGLALMALEHTQSVILQPINGRLVPVLLSLNPRWRSLSPEDRPQVTWNSPSTETIENLLEVYNSGLLNVRKQDREFLRAGAGLPELEEEDVVSRKSGSEETEDGPGADEDSQEPEEANAN